MRSHSKAPSAGSNSGRGASRRSLRRSGALTALLCALMAVACLLPASASAVEFRTVIDSFGSDGTSSGSFGFAGALGFDQGSKRLYALDAGAGKIFGFDASTPGSHTPLGGNFPLSVPVGEFNGIAADPSSHNIYYAEPTENELHGFDASGAPLSGFPIGGQNYSCGAAVNSQGDVFVAEGNEGIVKKYSPAGVLLGTISVSGGSFAGEPCHLAFDSEDNLYVGYYYGLTEKFKNDGEGHYFLSSSDRQTIDPESTMAMTVDKATGEVFVIHYNYIDVWDTEGNFLYELPGEPFGGEFNGIAINEATEELYVSDYGNGVVDVYSPPASLPKLSAEGADAISATGATVHGTVNPKEEAVEECHFEVVPDSQWIASKYTAVTPAQEFPCSPAAGTIPADASPHPVSASVTGLSAATRYHFRLVATNAIGEGASTDKTFTSGPALPLVEEQSAEAVGTTEVTVAAKINPRGGNTTYHVEYGTTNAYGQSTPESAPLGFPTDTNKHPVSVHIGGLNPGSAYHFRFVATNEAGTDEGDDTAFATYPVTGSPSGSCANEQFRTGFGARLPDCRAYEQGTPIDKHGSDALGRGGEIGTSPSGDRFSFIVTGGLPTTGGLTTIVPFIASRGPNGWSTDGIMPPAEPGFVGEDLGVNEELSATLVKGESPGGAGKQLFIRHSDTGAFEPGPVGPVNFFLHLVGFAADPAHVLFTSESQLLPGAVKEVSNLYDLDHGNLTLADRIPAGSAVSCDDESGPPCVVSSQGSNFISAEVGSVGTFPIPRNLVSRDGSRAFFWAPTSFYSTSGRIYVREDGVSTTWISASQRTTPDPGGEKPATYWTAAKDGSQVFFTSCEKLTDDSTAVSTEPSACEKAGEPRGEDLYSYDAGSGELTDLTVDSNPSDLLGANVQGVVGISDNGSYVYFVANGALAPGAQSGKGSNLYVYHEGVTKFIAASLGPERIWRGDEPHARVSANGKAVLFLARNKLTAYDNATTTACRLGNEPVGLCEEFYRYSAEDEKLLCVSCNPAGTPPRGNARLGTTLNLFVKGGASGGPSRNLSADGNRAFFESKDALVPADTNGVYDVYEWEAKGTGSCQSESQDGGCLYLISSGTSAEPAQFLGASKNGDHVFFFTEQQLVPTDQDHLFDVYDAGVGAGLADQHTLAPPSCSSTACQANPPPPPDPSLASSAYSGAGNAHRAVKARKCPKGKRKVRSAGKTRCQKARKQHKRHNNRGGAK